MAHFHKMQVIVEAHHFVQLPQTDMINSKIANQTLASEYRTLQNRVNADQMELLRSYSNRTQLENDLKDARQVRTNSILLFFFKGKDVIVFNAIVDYCNSLDWQFIELCNSFTGLNSTL